MNYKKIYYDLCEYCKNTDIKVRIKNRNINDFRLILDTDTIYTENHHIIPRHAGGDNSKNNLVKLLPEEHYMAHLIRWKAYNSRDDFLAVRFIVNGLVSKESIKEHFPDNETYKTFKRRLSLWTQHIYEFKKEHGWHTEEGITNISNARKNTFPAIDKITLKSVGSVESNHPKVLSGDWIHHSTNKISVTELKTGNKLYINKSLYDKSIHKFNGPPQNGKNNGNYKLLTNEFLEEIYKCIPLAVENNHFSVSIFMKLIAPISENYYHKRISKAWIDNNFNGFKKLIEIYNKEFDTNYIYDTKYRGFSSYKNAYIKQRKNET